jgi:hypothetical protein
MGFFEENPIVFVAAVIAIVEVWIRVREPLFRRVAGVIKRR